MSWEPELEELRRREELARKMGGEERVARQRESGRLNVRERVERFFDDGSFHETGALAGKGTYGDDGELEEFLPANMVVGRGLVEGRRTVVQADDFTVRGGAADAAIWEKMVWAERAAHDLRVPLAGWWTGPVAAAASRRSRRGASPTCRRCRASTSWSRTSPAFPSSPPPSARARASGPRA